jgi:hypothetical protein
MPSDSALALQATRGQFVVKLVMESAVASEGNTNIEGHGWEKSGDMYKVVWDNNVVAVRKELNKTRKKPVRRCGCKSSKTWCSGKGPGCVKCVKDCQPCTELCACKGACLNPHNNGGKCPQCSLSHVVEPTDLSDQHVHLPTGNELDDSDDDSRDDDVDEDTAGISEAEGDDDVGGCPEAGIDDYNDYFGDDDTFLQIPTMSLDSDDSSDESDYEDE